MDILIKPKKNRYIIYAIIIAIFSTVGMNISLIVLVCSASVILTSQAT